MHISMKILIVAPNAARSEALAMSLAATRDSVSASHTDQVDSIETEIDRIQPTVVLVDADVVGVVGSIRRHRPDLTVVVTSARIDDRQLDEAARHGIRGIVRTPCEPDALLRVLTKPEPLAEFKGQCSGVRTAVLLGLCCTAGYEGVLHLRTPDNRTGSIHLEAGQPIHASSGEFCGPEAVKDMLEWSDAHATWLEGRTGCARTILGRWEGLLDGTPETGPGTPDHMVPVAYPDVMEKLARLAKTPDILGAFLLRNAEVVTGRCAPHLDEAVVGRALCRLAHVFHDVEQQHAEEISGEIQATVGTQRLVVDRIGPAYLGFQVGVVVRQASPVCKSLRRLLRQIDRSFRKQMKREAETPASNYPGVEMRGDNGLRVA